MTDPTISARVQRLVDNMRKACPKWDYDQRNETDVLYWADELAALCEPIARLEQENKQLWLATETPCTCEIDRHDFDCPFHSALRGSDR